MIRVRFLKMIAFGAGLSISYAWAPRLLAETFVDDRASVRFDIPFDHPTIKTGEQIERHIASRANRKIPPGIIYTAGIYHPRETTYVLVWKRAYQTLPSRKFVDQIVKGAGEATFRTFGVEELNFDRQHLRGIGNLLAKKDLKGRILVQLTKTHTVFIGFYYTTDHQLRWFDDIVKTFYVLGSNRVTYGELPAGPIDTWIFVMVGGLFLSATAVAIWLARRRKLRYDAF